MKIRILIAISFFLSAFAAHAGQETDVRGILIWTDKKQTVTECKSGRVYWVRVLASNPHFHLFKKVEKLNPYGTTKIIAALHGELSLGTPSGGPSYFVDGILNVQQIVSVERGDCDK